MLKTFSIRKLSSRPQSKHDKKGSSVTSYSVLKKKITLLGTTKGDEDKMVEKINEAWSMVSAMGIQTNETTIIKYLKKKMNEKAYRYSDLIAEVLRTRCLPKQQKEIQDFSLSLLFFEIEQMKQELEIFLMKKFNKDIEIVQEQIRQADNNIKDYVDAEEYQRLVYSFRPALITNSTDLSQQFNNLSGSTAAPPPPSSRIQQLRYGKLNEFERDVCNMHNKVFLQKVDTKLFNCFKAIDHMF